MGKRITRSESEGAKRAVGRSQKREKSLRVDAAASGEPLPGEGREGGKLYYRIGKVSRITGVKPYVLRYWESEFRWMSPQKSRSKQRLYRPKDIETILLIKRLLYEERYTIAGARKKVRELMAGGQAGAGAGKAELEGSPWDLVRGLREELRSIRETLGA